MKHVTKTLNLLLLGLVLFPLTAAAQRAESVKSPSATPYVLESRAMKTFNFNDWTASFQSTVQLLRKESSNKGLITMPARPPASHGSGAVKAKASSSTTLPGQIIDESHIMDIAEQFSLAFLKSDDVEDNWVTTGIVAFERNASGLPTSVKETYQDDYYDDEEEVDVIYEFTFETIFEYTSNNLLESIALYYSDEDLEEPVMFGSLSFTYNAQGQVTGTTEVMLDEDSFEYDSVSADFTYENNTVSATLVYEYDEPADSDTVRISAVEGDSLVIETYESYLEEEDGNSIRYRELYRETFPELSTLTQYLNTAVFYYEDFITVIEEYYDFEEEEFFLDYRTSYEKSDSSIVLLVEYWEDEESEWINDVMVMVDLDSEGDASIITYAFVFDEEVYPFIREVINPSAELLQFVSVEDAGREQPDAFTLQQNYPNPFNPSTQIGFELRASGQVSLKVFDVMGREVASLVNQALPAGTHSVSFDASGLSSGVYFYRLQVVGSDAAGQSGFVQTRSMILQK